MTAPRINLTKASPELYRAVNHLDELVNQVIAAAGIAAGFAPSPAAAGIADQWVLLLRPDACPRCAGRQ